jgi:hypothetical protein
VAARGDVPAIWERAQAAAAEVGGRLDAASTSLARWNDPREKQIRRRRAATAVTAALTGTTSVLGVTTVGLAVSPMTEWVVVGSGGLTALVAVPTVAAAVRWRRLRRAPLPDPRPARVRRPGRDSLAHEPVVRLTHAERSLSELLGLLQRDPAVPGGEVEEARTAARAAVDALRREADDLGALERARDTSPAAAAELDVVVGAALVRLESGVRAYDGLVASAARAVAAGSGPERHSESITAAVDRVDALTAALTELAGLHAARR